MFQCKSLVREITTFVASYQSLNEVERKALKQFGEGIEAHQVVKQARTLLVPPCGSNVRYGGGAKERAKEREALGLATSQDEDVINGIACAWCAAPLQSISSTLGVTATYCSQECTEQGRIHRGSSSSLRIQMFSLEAGVCRRCHVNAHALYLRILSMAPAERLNALCDAKWRLPQSRVALNNLLSNPLECYFWEVDHIVAVIEGGGDCDLGNLRTLCVPCHKLETERLRNRLKLVQASRSVENDKRQLDIRSAFTRVDDHTKRQRKEPIVIDDKIY